MKPPLLVTGSHRSGTTWVGEMLCAGGGYAYLHEPFNATKYPHLLEKPMPGDFTYIDASNAREYSERIQRLFSYDFPLRENLSSTRRPTNWLRAAREDVKLRVAKSRQLPLLIKDPLALFSTPWLAETFDLQILILVRHPAAFASSLIRLNWQYDFGYLLSQDALMSGVLAPYASEIRRYAHQRQPLLDQATLLWRLVYGVVQQWRSEHPDWLIIRYEDLAENPVPEFSKLYAQLELNFSTKASTKISQFSDASNKGEAPSGDKGSTKRDSRTARDTWMTRLTPEQITSVHSAVQREADHFYSSHDWPTGHHRNHTQ